MHIALSGWRQHLAGHCCKCTAASGQQSPFCQMHMFPMVQALLTGSGSPRQTSNPTPASLHNAANLPHLVAVVMRQTDSSGQHVCVRSTCYGILMLLPQSHAFKTLHARLHSVPTQALLQLDALPRAQPEHADAPAAAEQDLQPLLALFRSCQVCNGLAVGAE